MFRMILFLSLMFTLTAHCKKNHLIYSISQDLPMGEENEVIKKNFYLNMGSKQGIKPGSLLNVYRLFSRDNSFSTDKKSFYKVKVGEIEVIHSEDENSIGIAKVLPKDSPLYFEVNNLMIGDHVDVKTN